MSTSILMKWGGGLISDKTGFEALRMEKGEFVLDRLAKEYAAFAKLNPHISLILCHGAGSFGHPQVKLGFSGDEVRASVRRLSQHVEKAFLNAGLTVTFCHPSDFASLELWKNAILSLISKEFLPVFHGDILAIDGEEQIFSTEDLMLFLLPDLKPSPSEIFLLMDEDGVIKDGELLKKIYFEEMSGKTLRLGEWPGLAHTDVTGGISSKIESALAMSTFAPSSILNGLVPNRMTKALNGKEEIMTKFIF